jgi:hypothetical protein
LPAIVSRISLTLARSALFADGVAGCSGSSSVADRLWQLLCAALPARRRVFVSIPALNQVQGARVMLRLRWCLLGSMAPNDPPVFQWPFFSCAFL